MSDVPLLPDLDEDPARVYAWLTTDDPSVTGHELGQVHVGSRLPGAAALVARVVRALELPRADGFLHWEPSDGWQTRRGQVSPIHLMRVWSGAWSDYPAAPDWPAGRSAVSAWALRYAELSAARQAARSGKRVRGHVRDLSEAVAALSGPAMAEFRDTRLSLPRWVAAWEPVEPPRPVFAATNRRGNSWR